MEEKKKTETKKKEDFVLIIKPQSSKILSRLGFDSALDEETFDGFERQMCVRGSTNNLLNKKK